LLTDFEQLIQDVVSVLEQHKGEFLSVTGIVDIMNYIGKCVVAGNVRRTAEIAFGDPNLPEYLDLKDYSKNPSRAGHGWTSNNSVMAKLGMDYSAVCDRIRLNGEPGFAWLENMQNYGRMADPPNYLDYRAAGGNPCLEQTLESYELCCLVETFPDKHESLEDFQETLKYAYMYAKTVTLGGTHWPEANAVMLRNRRIGTSMSGIAQFITNRGLAELKRWCDVGYQTLCDLDREISEKYSVPQSIKKTSIKPSGTVSLLAGATPGMHYPESRFYIRRVRLSKNSEMLAPLQKAGYHVEDAVGQSGTAIVEIPVDCGNGIRTVKDVSIWEQVSLAAFLQENWADNQVSCTVTFDPESEGNQLEHVLDHFQYKLKGISFLPALKLGAYPQMPYESISEEEYNSRMVSFVSLNSFLLNDFVFRAKLTKL
jgi:ribonucleoside-triphosphate reductase